MSEAGARIGAYRLLGQVAAGPVFETHLAVQIEGVTSPLQAVLKLPVEAQRARPELAEAISAAAQVALQICAVAVRPAAPVVIVVLVALGAVGAGRTGIAGGAFVPDARAVRAAELRECKSEKS